MRAPLHLCRGTLVLSVIITVMIPGCSLPGSREKEAATFMQYATNPLAGDIYRVIVSVDAMPYSTYAKYTRTSGDTLFMVLLKKKNQAVQWEGLDTQSAGVFNTAKIPGKYILVNNELHLSVIGQPTQSMVLSGVQRNGKLYKQFAY